VDQILDSASRAGLRVIIAIIDNWQELDGVPSYLNVSLPAAACRARLRIWRAVTGSK
jgi:hypothetical protein